MLNKRSPTGKKRTAKASKKIALRQRAQTKTISDAVRVQVVKRVAKRRATLRRAGLRPIQIWVPDTRAPGFAEECRRQSLLLRDDPQERETLDWLDRAVDTTGWT